MGDSHYKSNIIAKNGTEKITGFSYIASITNIKGITNIQADTMASAPALKASSYINIGGKYILTSTYSLAASIQAEATALLGTAPKGTITLGAGELWLFTADNTATMLTAP